MKSRAHIRDAILDRLAPWLIQRLEESDAQVIFTDFDEIRAATGFSLRSGTSHRAGLYTYRDDLAEKGLWFAAEWGRGLNWTLDTFTGVQWFDGMNMRHMLNRADHAVTLVRIALLQIEPEQRPLLTAWVVQAEWFQRLTQTHKAEVLRLIDEHGGDGAS